jgi:RNA polymerase sigma factor (TIGR02999 family)
LDATISSLITGAERGERDAASALFSALYSELHRLAQRQLEANAGMSLGATSLLHEAYLNIARREGVSFPDRARFMGYAARVMRGLIIDYVRRRQALKRGGEFELVTLSGEEVAARPDADALARLGDAVDELAVVDPALAQIVDLRFFCGFGYAEIAALRGISERTAKRQWERARIYLHRTLRDVP